MKKGMLLLPLLISLLSGCMTITVSEKQLLLPDKEVTASNIDSIAPGYALRALTVIAADGTRLAGQILQHPAAKSTVLYFGGNNFRMQQSGRHVAEGYSKLGVNLIMIDHRGYGDSEGEPSIETLFSDGLSTFDAVSRELPGQPIIVHGFSLGSFIAGHVGKHRPLAALVLEGSATNADQWAAATTPWFAKPFIDVVIEPKLQAINNLNNVAELTAPLLIVVGEHDRLTPPALSRKLYAAATKTSYHDYLEVPDLDHNSALKQPRFVSQFLALQNQLHTNTTSGTP